MWWGTIALVPEDLNARSAGPRFPMAKYDIPLKRGSFGPGECLVEIRTLGSAEPRPTIENVERLDENGSAWPRSPKRKTPSTSTCGKRIVGKAVSPRRAGGAAAWVSSSPLAVGAFRRALASRETNPAQAPETKNGRPPTFGDPRTRRSGRLPGETAQQQLSNRAADGGEELREPRRGESPARRRRSGPSSTGAPLRTAGGRSASGAG